MTLSISLSEQDAGHLELGKMEFNFFPMHTFLRLSLRTFRDFVTRSTPKHCPPMVKKTSRLQPNQHWQTDQNISETVLRKHI